MSIPRSLISTLTATLLSSAFALTSAYAQDGVGAQKYLKECAACHIAYPARALPAVSWQSLMGTLNKHFGNDASLSVADSSRLVTL
jgi:hypothetical protein